MSSTQERIISRVCPQCGRVLEESWVSCPYCGRNLTGRQKQLRMTFKIPASIKVRFSSVVYWSLYLSVLLVSYLLGHFYPFFAPYGWLLVPVVASFFVGYLIREVYTAVKLIIVCLTLNTGIVFVLLIFSSVENAFNAMPTFASYWVFHILLGILVSFVATTVRDYIGP